jgi:ABC-2 type transport system permease protein
MISLGLLIASRSSSEELADGILNLITWPMMIFSEVWFSMEGANPIIIKISKIFPLTQLVDGARKIMNDGLGLYEIRYNIIFLVIMSVIFLISGSLLFKWHKT